jgi:MFS family permease
MLTMMSNVAIVTMLPHLSNIFPNVPNIELLSRLMITLPSLAIAIFAPFLGHIIEKFGKKKAAIIALLGFSFFGTAGLYLHTIYEILASRFLFGIAIAVLMIVTTSLIGDYFKNEHRHKFMGLQSAFIAIGGMVFIVGGGFLSDINWRYPFAIYALGLIVLLFVMKYLVEHKNSANFIEDDEHLLNHNLWYIYVLAFILMLVFYILPTQMPFLMINVFHASGTLTGAIIATAFIFNAAGALTFVKLKKHFKFNQIYLTGMGIIALGFILIGFVNNVYLFFLTSPILGFGGGILMANISTWMLHVAHHTKRVKSSGYLTSALFFGQFCSPIVTHPFVEYFGIKDFFIASGITLTVVLFVFLIKQKA